MSRVPSTQEALDIYAFYTDDLENFINIIKEGADMLVL